MAFIWQNHFDLLGYGRNAFDIQSYGATFEMELEDYLKHCNLASGLIEYVQLCEPNTIAGIRLKNIVDNCLQEKAKFEANLKKDK